MLLSVEGSEVQELKMDSVIEKAIYRLESTAILPFKDLAPTLAIIIHGDSTSHPADYSYLRSLMKAGSVYGADIHVYPCFNEIQVSDTIVELTGKPDLYGIMIISDFGEATRGMYNMIPSRLDIDGLSTLSIGKLVGSTNPIAYRNAPPTPIAVLKILQELMVERQDTLVGKKIAIIGRSLRVGRPLQEILIQQDASVMMFHSKSPVPADKFDKFDIIISAMGKPKYIDSTKVNPQGKILIDVGINIDENGKICGDMDYENLKGYASYITPVPNGVGPMTTVCLFAKLFANKRSAYEFTGRDV